MKAHHYFTHKKSILIITNLLDFVPLVGSIKMIVEGVKGRQFGTGKELRDVPRGIHTVAGFSFLFLDMTTVSVIFSEFGKGLVKLGVRTLEKTAEGAIARDSVIKVVQEIGIHELIKKESSVLIEKAEAKLEKR
jgi:hypothetical protein